MGRRGASMTQDMVGRIVQAVESLQYGTVQITVHDAHVVQIEKIERVRISPAADLTPGRHPHTPAPADRTTGPARPRVAD